MAHRQVVYCIFVKFHQYSFLLLRGSCSYKTFEQTEGWRGWFFYPPPKKKNCWGVGVVNLDLSLNIMIYDIYNISPSFVTGIIILQNKSVLLFKIFTWKSAAPSTILSFLLASRKARQFSTLFASYIGILSSACFNVKRRSLSLCEASEFGVLVSIDFLRYLAKISSEVSRIRWGKNT